MANTLILVSSLTKNNRVFVKNLLLNSSRIIDFYANPANSAQTVMYYRIGDKTTWKLTLNHLPAVISNKIYEDITNPVRKLHVLSQKVGLSLDKPVDEMRYFNSDSVIYGMDISTTQSYLFCDRGNSEIRATLSHVVSDVSRAYSQSASLSAS